MTCHSLIKTCSVWTCKWLVRSTIICILLCWYSTNCPKNRGLFPINFYRNSLESKLLYTRCTISRRQVKRLNFKRQSSRLLASSILYHIISAINSISHFISRDSLTLKAKKFHLTAWRRCTMIYNIGLGGAYCKLNRVARQFKLILLSRTRVIRCCKSIKSSLWCLRAIREGRLFWNIVWILLPK